MEQVENTEGRIVFKIAGGRSCTYCSKDNSKYVIGNINNQKAHQFCDSKCFCLFVQEKQIDIYCHYDNKPLQTNKSLSLDNIYITCTMTWPTYYCYCNSKCNEMFIKMRNFNEEYKKSKMCRQCSLDEIKFEYPLTLKTGYENKASSFPTIYFCSQECKCNYIHQYCCFRCCRSDGKISPHSDCYSAFTNDNGEYYYCTSTFIHSPPTCYEIVSNIFNEDEEETTFCTGCRDHNARYPVVKTNSKNIDSYFYLCKECINKQKPSMFSNICHYENVCCLCKDYSSTHEYRILKYNIINKDSLSKHSLLVCLKCYKDVNIDEDEDE